jgi:hypothetical protein
MCQYGSIQPAGVCVFSFGCIAQSELHLVFNLIGSSPAWFVSKRIMCGVLSWYGFGAAPCILSDKWCRSDKVVLREEG